MGSFLYAIVLLPLHVYYTLYARLVSLGSKRNSRDTAQGLAVGTIALTQLFLVFSILDEFVGTVAFLGKIGMAAVFFGFFVADYFILYKGGYGDRFEAELTSMPVARRIFLDILAVGYVISVFVFFFWSAPPLPSQS